MKPFWPEVLGFLLQHFAVADDGVERGAQLVAHVGQEGALGPVGDLGGFLGFQELGVLRLESFAGALFLLEHLLAESLRLATFAHIENTGDERPAQQQAALRQRWARR